MRALLVISYLGATIVSTYLPSSGSQVGVQDGGDTITVKIYRGLGFGSHVPPADRPQFCWDMSCKSA